MYINMTTFNYKLTLKRFIENILLIKQNIKSKKEHSIVKKERRFSIKKKKKKKIIKKIYKHGIN